jgi:hypothetical protein
MAWLHNKVNFYTVCSIADLGCYTFLKIKLFQNLVSNITFGSRMGSHWPKSWQTMTLVLPTKKHHWIRSTLLVKVDIKHLHNILSHILDTSIISLNLLLLLLLIVLVANIL